MDKTGISRKKVVSFTAIGGFSISVLYATGAGLYFLDIVDAFINSYSIIVVGLGEAVFIGWFLGAHTLSNHANSVSIYSIGRWWDVMVKYVTPGILTYILLQNIIKEIKEPYGGYPTTALVLIGWGVVALIVASAFIASKKTWQPGALQLDYQQEVE